MHYRSLAYKCLTGALIGLTAMSVTPVFAYVEPGTGNLLLQLLFGGAAGIGLLIKLYWKSLTSTLLPWLRPARAQPSEPQMAEAQEEQDQAP